MPEILCPICFYPFCNTDESYDEYKGKSGIAEVQGQVRMVYRHNNHYFYGSKGQWIQL